jgi:septal ring factor EnvC (AmiA/AmiB activator)
MNQLPRLHQGARDELPRDLVELSRQVAALPTEHRSRIEAVLERVVESTKRRRRIMDLVQDALNQLRLDMKYLIFDLEATRQERDQYRQRIEENNRED